MQPTTSTVHMVNVPYGLLIPLSLYDIASVPSLLHLANSVIFNYFISMLQVKHNNSNITSRWQYESTMYMYVCVCKAGGGGGDQ